MDTAEFNSNTLNANINKVIEQIKELVELGNKFTEFPDPIGSQFLSEKRPVRYFELASMLRELVQIRKDTKSTILQYIEEINRIQEDAESAISAFEKPKLAPAISKK